jgi:hypothetical protein
MLKLRIFIQSSRTSLFESRSVSTGGRKSEIPFSEQSPTRPNNAPNSLSRHTNLRRSSDRFAPDLQNLLNANELTNRVNRSNSPIRSPRSETLEIVTAPAKIPSKVNSRHHQRVDQFFCDYVNRFWYILDPQNVDRLFSIAMTTCLMVTIHQCPAAQSGTTSDKIIPLNPNHARCFTVRPSECDTAEGLAR